MDFVHDQLATGRKIRVLTVVDTFSRRVPVLLEMPLSPMAWASSSTRRVDTPPIRSPLSLGPMAFQWLTLDHHDQSLFRGLARFEEAGK